MIRHILFFIGVLIFMAAAFVGLPVPPTYAQEAPPPPMYIYPTPRPLYAQPVIFVPRPPSPVIPFIPSCIPYQTLFGPACHPIVSYFIPRINQF